MYYIMCTMIYYTISYYIMRAPTRRRVARACWGVGEWVRGGVCAGVLDEAVRRVCAAALRVFVGTSGYGGTFSPCHYGWACIFFSVASVLATINISALNAGGSHYRKQFRDKFWHCGTVKACTQQALQLLVQALKAPSKPKTLQISLDACGSLEAIIDPPKSSGVLDDHPYSPTSISCISCPMRFPRADTPGAGAPAGRQLYTLPDNQLYTSSKAFNNSIRLQTNLPSLSAN